MLERKYNKAKKVIRDFQLQLEQRDKKYNTIITDMKEYISSLQLKLGEKDSNLVMALNKSPLFTKLMLEHSLTDFDMSDGDDPDVSMGQYSVSFVTFLQNCFQLGLAFRS